MKTIFVLDEKNYTEDMPLELRTTVRALIWRDGKLAMQRAASGDYKIPGGGMAPGEDRMTALAREVWEETGLSILTKTAREIGETVEKRRDVCDPQKRFERHTYFYEVEAGDEVAPAPLHLTDSEKALGFSAVWADPEEAAAANLHSLSERHCTERDTKFLIWYLAQDRVLAGRRQAVEMTV